MKRLHTLEEVLAAVEQGRTVTGTAKALGVSRRTILRYRRLWKKVDEALREWRQELIDLAEEKLWEAVERGEPWAIRFTLATLGKYEFSLQVEAASPQSLVVTIVRENERKVDIG